MATMQLAPEYLNQPILPWTWFQNAMISGVTVNIGSTSKPDTERAILDEVGSYGRQLGRIGDALEVLVKRLDRTGLTPAEDDALAMLLGQLAEIRAVKARG